MIIVVGFVIYGLHSLHGYELLPSVMLGLGFIIGGLSILSLLGFMMYRVVTERFAQRITK